jgi:signal transduction histidine kinase
MLQKLAETALVLCRADTAGISLVEAHGDAEVFRWEALAGVFAFALNHKMPRAASPCGVCIDVDATQLMYLSDRLFPALPKDPRFVEVLLLPFHFQGRPIGTVWAVMHQFDRQFDREDERMLRSLASFASAGWQLWKAREDLEGRVLERTAELSKMNAVLQKEIKERQRIDAERKLLLRRVTFAQEEERRRIARELHDSLAQRLAVLRIDLELTCRDTAREPSRVAAELALLMEQVDKFANEVRGLSHRLHPSILDDLGLEAALQDVVGEYEHSSRKAPRFTSVNLSRPVPLPVASALYRITQEALSNAAKHAPGAAVTVTLSETAREFCVTIHDDGPGFDPEAVRSKGGLGLVSMQERAQLLGGQVTLRSMPGGGTEVRAAISGLEH